MYKCSINQPIEHFFRIVGWLKRVWNLKLWEVGAPWQCKMFAGQKTRGCPIAWPLWGWNTRWEDFPSSKNEEELMSEVDEQYISVAVIFQRGDNMARDRDELNIERIILAMSNVSLGFASQTGYYIFSNLKCFCLWSWGQVWNHQSACLGLKSGDGCIPQNCSYMKSKSFFSMKHIGVDYFEQTAFGYSQVDGVSFSISNLPGVDDMTF